MDLVINKGTSSSSFAHQFENFDVFLSFRGEDTRYGFTSFLYDALYKGGIHTFLDDNLPRGAKVSAQLFKTIENSTVLIIIFSENYASSTWCLDELAKIVECKKCKKNDQLIIPVFYKVDPSEIRKQNGKFGDALAEHEKNMDYRKVQRWRNALREAANLSGWPCNHSCNESNFIQSIVDHISNLKLNRPPLFVAQYLVGIDNRIETILSDIMSNDAHMIGIYGIGGIGKTTITREIYNRICGCFERFCYLENVREKSKTNDGVIELQEELLFEILRIKKLKVGNKSRGINMIKERLSVRRILLVLDDVDKNVQIENLLGECNWFASGSKIIITTRDKHLVATLGKCFSMHEVKELNQDEALELFSMHAFQSREPEEDYLELANQVIQYAKGLPLALVVIGADLCRKTKLEWKSAIDNYERIPNKEIQKVLKISYDGLDEVEQDIFLDIACFFKGFHKKYVMDVLGSCDLDPTYGIKKLIDMCLITVDQYDKLSMHDLLQQMGKNIVRRESPQLPGERSRLWHYKDVLDVLTENMGSKKVLGIMICSAEPSKIQLEPKCLEKMKNLKFLIASNVEICADLEYIPNGLRVLDWRGFPLSSLPSNFYPQKLTVLNMPESRVILYKLLERIQCKSLVYMNFQSCQCIRELPDLSIATPNIKQLNLRECMKLVKVHNSNGCLDKLESWDLTGCIELQILPSCIMMKSLKFLILYECNRFERFPDIPQEMENLKFLSLAYTAIRELPSSFGNLIGLERLDIGSYFYSCHLPSSIYKLQYLRKLILHGNVQFAKDAKINRQARNSYGGFSKYGFLMLNLVKNLTSCFHLSKKDLLSGSENLNIRDSIVRFNGLDFLLIEDSMFLKKIPKLPESIRSVYVSNCISLNSKSLRKLFLQFGRNLELSPNMKCSGVKGNVFVDSHLHQIDYSSELSLSKFFLIEEELHSNLDVYLIDFGERYNIIVPEKKIPKWFNHQSIESSISFWVGPKFPTFAFCTAFHLVPLKDNYANNDKCGSLRDDIISWVCVVNISINGHMQPFMRQPIFQGLKCDHLWFYGVPQSQLQHKFGVLLHGDQNHVEVSCKISHWTSEFGKFAPVIARMGAHVECTCPPQNSTIIHNNSQNFDYNSDNTEFAPLLQPVSTDSDVG